MNGVAITHTFVDTATVVTSMPEAAAFAVRIAPIVSHGVLTAQAQTHVVAPRSQPIAIPTRKTKVSTSPTSSSCPTPHHVRVPSNKHSYIVDSSGAHPAYTFGPGKINHLTLTGVRDLTVTLDAAISGVDCLRCRNVTLHITRPTPCNVELSQDITILGPAEVETSASMNITLNGNKVHCTPFSTNTRHQLAVDGMVGAATNSSLPLPEE